ncbi:MAG: VCBS repeat-containing protein [Verrucomicrobia bacterium]|nr:VCBS repeat-containing protein [Verrucomicrobiota bacterium]
MKHLVRPAFIQPIIGAALSKARNAWLVATLFPTVAMAELNFERVILDPSYFAYERDVGDIDGDGDNDLVAIQEGDTSLQVFRAPTWARSTLVTFTGTDRYPRADDFKLADIDGDGDLDAVTRLGPGPADDGPGIAVWCENLGGGSNFTQHLIGKSLEYVKDIVIADFDRDGRPDVAMRMDRRTQLWLQNATNWTEVLLSHAPHEGMEAGDLDMDGDPDLILNGFWFPTPDTPAAARIAANYTNQVIDAAWFKQTGDWTANSCKVVVGDFDGDGANDVAFSQSERAGYTVAWYRSPTPRADGTWRKQPVAIVDYCHNLQAADWDLDGDVDLLVGGMIQSQHRGLKLMLNTGGGTNWTEFVIQRDGSYSAESGDIDNDGDLDIVGIRNWNSAPTWIYRNNVRTARLARWTYHQVSAAHVRTFGLCFPDVDGDGDLDIASGPFVYLNPGAPLTNAWTQVALPSGVHAFATLDIDGDGFADLLAQKDNRSENRIDLFWVEAANAKGTSWGAPIRVGNVPRSDHPEGFQGYRVAQLVAGGRPEIAVSTMQGVYYFVVPESNPAVGNWPRTFVTRNDSDENVGVADIDGDGDLDISFTTGASKQVKWARNPGGAGGNWTVFAIGAFPEADWPDRCEAADLNGDGRVDIVATEENSGKAPDALACWWEQPADGPTNDNWPRHTIATQYTMNNLDLADIDKDGDIDLVLAEHRGTKRIGIWENNGLGVFTERRVGEGRESHLGGRLADLDGDGDLDLISIAYDDFTKLHLWRNDNARRERNLGAPNEHVAPDPDLTRPSDTLSPPRGEGRGEGSAARQAEKVSRHIVTSRPDDWGVVQATLGDGPEGDGTVLLENRAIRVRYTAKRFPDNNKDHVIVDFLVKKTGGQLATGSQLDGIWMNADEGRGKITAARVVYDGTDRKTLRVEWDNGKVVQEFTLWPNRPLIRIDYVKYGINIVDLVTSVDAFEVFGAEAWQKARASVTNEALFKIANPHHRLTTNLYPAYPFPILAVKDWDAREPKELTYAGHLILGAYRKETGLGFGRVLPAQDANYVKLLKMGFEVFANWRQPHRRFTSYLFAVTGGPEELISVGQAIANEAGASTNYVGGTGALTPTPRATDVRLTENAVDQSAGGLSCYKIETPVATYFLEKTGAGLSSMIDKDGHDWLGFHPTQGSRAGGEFRGFPNAVDNPAGSYFHAKNAGTTPSTTKVELVSPERVSISAVSSNGWWGCRYDFFPTHCTFTMTRMPPAEKYWVLYEGTPGGQFDETDWWMTSAVSQPKPMTQPHDGDIPAPEWIAFGDTKSSRVLFLLHHEDDPHPDRFYQMDKKMTVFGFGRQGMKKFLDREPQGVSIGFLETTNHAEISRALDKLSTTKHPDSRR